MNVAVMVMKNSVSFLQQYSMESAIVSKYKSDLEEKDKEIEQLKSENKKLKVR